MAASQTELTFVCISDTHCHHEDLAPLPKGDVLLVCGDFTEHGTPREVGAFVSWLREQPHRHKVVIAGNHDMVFDLSRESRLMATGFTREELEARCAPACARRARGLVLRVPSEQRGGRLSLTAQAARLLVTGPDSPCTYLEGSETTVEGVRIWGAPWTPRSWGAFQYSRSGSEASARWAGVPDGVDVVVTHGPVHGHGDGVPDPTDRTGKAVRRVGCRALKKVLLRRVRPPVHVFGHIHESHGVTSEDGVFFCNAANCNVKTMIEHPPVVFTLIKRAGFRAEVVFGGDTVTGAAAAEGDGAEQLAGALQKMWQGREDSSRR